MTDQVTKRGPDRPAEKEQACSRPVVTPPVDICTKEDGTILLADMPGVDENSVDIHLEDGVLTIEGRVSREEIPEHRLVFSEYRTGDFQRSFRLSENIDTNRIEATIRNGILRLFLPEAEKAKPKKIKVRV